MAHGSVDGDDSPQVKAFTDAQTEEFDRFVEYRLCFQLRNMSQRVGQVIANIKARGERGANDEMQVVHFEVTVDPAKLLATYRKWGPCPRRPSVPRRYFFG